MGCQGGGDLFCGDAAIDLDHILAKDRAAFVVVVDHGSVVGPTTLGSVGGIFGLHILP